MTSLTQDAIRTKLAGYNQLDRIFKFPYPEGYPKTAARQAAVLIPFIQMLDEWHILYIRRTQNANDRHSGQVAFPGGSVDPTDKDIIDTARREAHEEIGVHPDDVQILGRLSAMHTVTNFVIHPIVGVIPWPYELILQPSEVSRVFTIPVDWLAEKRNRRIENRQLSTDGISVPVIYFNEYLGETLWGASAGITVQLLEALELI